jgi:hypothetical protein
MRVPLMISLMALWTLAGLSGSAAEPPANAPAPAASTPATTPAVPSAPGAAKTPAAHAPSAATPAPAEPDRIDPTEKVHSDAEISFPVDI